MGKNDKDRKNYRTDFMFSRLEEKLDNIGYTWGFVLAFLIGFIIRIIPELLSFPYPIGWDTIYYAYRINEGIIFGYWNDIFSTWLPYGIMIGLGNVTQLDPFLLLKIIGPLFFGGSAAGIYFVAWKKLDWNVTKSLMAAGLFSISIAEKIGIKKIENNITINFFNIFFTPFILI